MAGKAIARAAEAISSSLVRIATGGLRDVDLDRPGRLLLGNGREEDEDADNEHEYDDQDCYSGHGQRFCRGATPLYSPLKRWIWGSVLTGPWFSSG